MNAKTKLLGWWTLIDESDRLGLKTLVGCLAISSLYVLRYVFGGAPLKTVVGLAIFAFGTLILLYILFTVLYHLIRYLRSK